MGWFTRNDLTWQQLQERMTGTVVDPLANADGGDGPGFGRHRPPYDPSGVVAGTSTIPYAELHCHSNFSFLDGASSPEELVEEAVRLGLSALAITDHDNLSGVVRFAEAAKEFGLPTVYGAELGLSGTPRPGPPDPEDTHLLVLARGQEGYAHLSRQIALAHLAGEEKGKRIYKWDDLVDDLRGHAVILTGCRKGAVGRAIRTARRGPGDDVDGGSLNGSALNGSALSGGALGGLLGSDPAAELDRLVDAFGRDGVIVELIDHASPRDRARNDALAALAADRGLPTIATGGVHFHHPSRRRLAAIVAAVRARSSLDAMAPHLATTSAYLRSGDEMAARFARYPGAVERAAALGAELAFDLHLIAPSLPPFADREGHPTEDSYLRHLVYAGAERRYGPPSAHPYAYERIEHELAIISELTFPGYFLVVWEIVDFCKRNNIFCQGRGSAANSVVCYALGITNVDPVDDEIGVGLIFERFLAPERDGPPDIDVDIESGRREEVIQHVYEKYGRRHAAQVANVISYRPRSAVRDVARAFGYSPGQQDAWSKQIERWTGVSSDAAGIPEHVVRYANQLLDAPRHLGIHSGGMVICDRPIIDVCPVEWARMPGRTVLQWDKDDCAAINLVKFDLLGLGMLSALHYAFDFLKPADAERAQQFIDLSPTDPEVYAMLCAADTVGVFQVESRAQMSTLPRLRPQCFYDIVVEVALIRPGPIQGGSVHPYIRRKNGLEDVVYPHPLMKNSLERTLGVPLFQEQMMQLAVDTAGFSPAEADELRRAMGSKRSMARMERLKQRLYDGMAANDISPEVADDIYTKLAAFANYGFPESHAISFAYLVYASAWLKRYHPAAFTAALLVAQPMGFYSPQSLVDDARRHGVTVLRPDINASLVKASLEYPDGCRASSLPGEPPGRWGIGGPIVRLGLDMVRTLGTDAAERIVAERTGSVSTGSVSTGSGSTGSGSARSGRARSGRARSGSARSGSAGSGSAGSGSARSGSARSGSAGSGSAGSGSARSGSAGLGSAGLGSAGLGSAGSGSTGFGGAGFGGAGSGSAAGGAYSSMTDLARRTGLSATHLEALATADAFRSLGLARREALWAAGAAATDTADRLPGTTMGTVAPPLPGMDEVDMLRADVWATGLSPTHHPVELVRPALNERGVLPIARLSGLPNGERVLVGGLVTHRQRPATASGITFLSLADETGMLNVVCSPGLWQRYRTTALTSAAMLIRGRVEVTPTTGATDVVNLVAEKLMPLPIVSQHRSRDFR